VIADAGKAQAPPGALRTAVRRQAGLRAYELPWGMAAPSPSQALQAQWLTAFEAADGVTARSPLRGQR